MKLDYFRLILTEDKQLPLLPPEYTNRSCAIKGIFSTDFIFRTAKGKEFEYIYQAQEDDYILGFIYEKYNLRLLEDPRSGEKQIRPDWKPQIVLINDGSTKGEGSQLFLLEHNKDYNTNQRLNLLNKSLADKLNQFLVAKHCKYRAEFNPVLEKVTFWDIAKRDDLKELTIEYNMPNYLGITSGANRINERLRVIQQYTNATKVKESIINDNANLTFTSDDEDLSDTIELTQSGQSKMIIKGVNQEIIYDSTEHEKIKSINLSIDEINLPMQNEDESNKLLKTFLEGLKGLK